MKLWPGTRLLEGPGDPDVEAAADHLSEALLYRPRLKTTVITGATQISCRWRRLGTTL